MVILHKFIQLLNSLFFRISTNIITAIIAVRTSAMGNVTRISRLICGSDFAICAKISANGKINSACLHTTEYRSSEKLLFFFNSVPP